MLQDEKEPGLQVFVWKARMQWYDETGELSGNGS